MEKTIEIPEGYEARIEGNKVILEPKESEDERIRTRLIALVEAFGQGTYKDEMLAYLEKQKEQKPAEWSEEDEKNLKLAYDLLVNGVEADRRYPELISWLKSLRPQPHWKPSEEQMWALFAASERNDKLGAILNNLYNDLKKL